MMFFIAAIALRFSALKASAQAEKKRCFQIIIQAKQAGHDFKVTTCLFNSKNDALLCRYPAQYIS